MVSVWTGSRLLIFGGEFYAGGPTINFYNDGAAYNPLTNQWTAMASAPIAGRREATGVWTGSKMIVFGGLGSSSAVFGDGASYDPAANTWAQLPSAGAPQPRTFHTAVWTGTKMIIFGGRSYSPNTYFGDGGLYDPATNSWSAISMVGAPSARYAHSAVWTGSKMIIFGGFSGPNALNDGGIYDPATNSWTSLPTAGAPSPRNGHTAIWTGQQMIVFGGYATSGANLVSQASGAAFNPATNAWTNISNMGAPSARYDHAAVWTGSRMVIFGGYNGSSVVAGGAIYDPVSDSWTPLATAGAPSARASFGSVWTGNRMLIFGGASSNAVFGDGAYLY